MSKEMTRQEVAEKIALWLVKGVEKGSAKDKIIVRLCGNCRIWTQTTETEIRVGFHGRGKPIITLKRRR